MKTFLLIIVTTISTLAFSHDAYGGDKVTFLKHAHLEISTLDVAMSELILKSKFNYEDGNIDFLFASDIQLIQVFNEDETLNMVLPVGTSDLRMGLSLFEKGTYKLGLVIAETLETKFIDITIR